MGTTYFPSEGNEWTGVIDSYTVAFRYKVSNSFNPSTRKSTITVTPQMKVNHTGAWYALGLDWSGRRGMKIQNSTYLLDRGIDGTNKYMSASTESGSWVDFTPHNFTISTFTVDHDSNGDAEISLGVWATIGFIYGSQTVTQYTSTTVGADGYDIKTLTIHEAAVGMAHISNGTTFENYQVYISNGTAFEQYVPYISNGTSFEQCG